MNFNSMQSLQCMPQRNNGVQNFERMSTDKFGNQTYSAGQRNAQGDEMFRSIDSNGVQSYTMKDMDDFGNSETVKYNAMGGIEEYSQTQTDGGMYDQGCFNDCMGYNDQLNGNPILNMLGLGNNGPQFAGLGQNNSFARMPMMPMMTMGNNSNFNMMDMMGMQQSFMPDYQIDMPGFRMGKSDSFGAKMADANTGMHFIGNMVNTGANIINSLSGLFGKKSAPVAQQQPMNTAQPQVNSQAVNLQSQSQVNIASATNVKIN